jgi:hypothetical protein
MLADLLADDEVFLAGIQYHTKQAFRQRADITDAEELSKAINEGFTFLRGIISLQHLPSCCFADVECASLSLCFARSCHYV